MTMDKQDIASQIRAHITEEWLVTKTGKQSGGNVQMTEKANKLKELESRCSVCQKCELYGTATNLVFSDGSPEAEIVFIGEAPGADEDAQGKPFVGRAGKLLTATIEGQGLRRDQVYICNILKHRPPENRNPLPNEIEACTPFLVEQLSILQPKLIITLGNFSTKFMLNTEEGITKLRGNIRKSPMGYQLMPTYHPAAVLRNMGLIEDLRGDIRKALEYINK